MGWVTKGLASLVLLAIGVLMIVPTALAYSIPAAVRTGIQASAAALTVGAVACVWFERRHAAVACIAVAVLITLGVILLA